MKKISAFVLLLFGLSDPGFAQFYNNGAQITVNTGGLLFLNDVFQNASGTLTNKGTVQAQFDWINSGNVVHSGAAAQVILSGTDNSIITSGGQAFTRLTLQKGDGVSIFLGDAMTISTSLTFSPLFYNNFVLMGNHDLTFDAAATVTGAQNDHYLVTDGTGMVKKNACATFTFPVGFNSTDYNPVTIAEAGTKDTKSVRCLESAPDGGVSGTALTKGVANAGWQIAESAAGGSNAGITLQWDATDELPGFDNTHCAVHRYAAGWQPQTASGAAAGADPFTRLVPNAGSFGYFMVGTPGVFFQAANDRFSGETARISVFPNPAKEVVSVRITVPEGGVFSVDWLDVSGKKVFSEQVNLVSGENQIEQSIGKLEPGFYFVKIQGSGLPGVKVLKTN